MLRELRSFAKSCGAAPERALIAGIELGGTKCIASLGDASARILDQAIVATGSPGETLAALRGTLTDWNSRQPLGGIGIAAFGPLILDPRNKRFGQIGATPKPGWTATDLLAAFQDLEVPVELDTDVNGAALAEGLWGDAQDFEDYAYVTIGTGVGVGSIVGGAPVRGAGHSEAGHMRVRRMPEDSWPGCCPFHGDCVEGIASGAAILARASIARPKEDWEGWLPVADAIALLFHNLVLTTAPNMICVGGGVALGAPWLLPEVVKRLTSSLNGYAHAAEIGEKAAFVRLSGLQGQAGPLGSLALAMIALSRHEPS